MHDDDDDGMANDYEFSWIGRTLNGLEILPPVRDQGDRPSCTFHAFSSGKEILVRRTCAMMTPPRSSMFLYNVNSFITDYETSIGKRLGEDHPRGRVWSRGHILIQHGVEATNPPLYYLPQRMKVERIDAHGDALIGGFDSIMDLIKQGYPLIGGFMLCNDFKFLGRDEIYEYNNIRYNEPDGHMVVFIGFGSRGGRKYLVFLNSYGTGFGQDGFGRVWYDECLAYHTIDKIEYSHHFTHEQTSSFYTPPPGGDYEMHLA